MNKKTIIVIVALASGFFGYKYYRSKVNKKAVEDAKAKEIADASPTTATPGYVADGTLVKPATIAVGELTTAVQKTELPLGVSDAGDLIIM